MNDDNLDQLAGLLGPCPTCSNGKLRAVSDGEVANFLCEDCGSCWHAELAWVKRVNPATCPGCASAAICAGSCHPSAAVPPPEVATVSVVAPGLTA